MKSLATLLLLAPLASVGSQPKAHYMYDIAALPDASSTRPLAINDSGQITGYCSTAAGTVAFITGEKGMNIKAIAGLGEVVASRGLSINASGQVVGSAFSSLSLVGFSTEANGEGAKLVLPPVESASLQLNSINTGGTSVGWYSYFSGGTQHTQSFTRAPDSSFFEFNPLGSDISAATVINDDGLVGGTALSESDGQIHVFLGTPGSPMADLGNPLGGAITIAGISSDGRVAGSTSDVKTIVPIQSTRDETLTTRPTLGGNEGVALAVTEKGGIVGYSYKSDNKQRPRAFIAASHGKLYDLNQFVVNKPKGLSLTRVTGINKNGQMAVWGDDLHGYIVCPTKACR